MKLKFTRSGGFMGGLLEKEAEAETLTPALQAIAQSLVNNAKDLKDLSKNENLRDGFQYAFELKIEGKRVLKLRFDESNLPAEIAPLVGYFVESV